MEITTQTTKYRKFYLPSFGHMLPKEYKSLYNRDIFTSMVIVAIFPKSRLKFQNR